MRFTRVVLITLSLLLYSCSEKSGVDTLPEVLRIGILPDEDQDSLIAHYTPLFRYLAEELQISYQLVIPSSYQDLLDEFAKGKIDLAYFGGLTFLQAYHRFGAVPVVMRDIDANFTSYFISRAEMPQQNLNEFRNMRFCFGSRLSTSGHLMPRYFLGKNNIEPEKYFSKIVYSGQHDKTIFSVVRGEADLGAVNAKIFDKLAEKNIINLSGIRIIWETPPYTDYVWALRASFSDKTRMRIRNVFLALSPSNPGHRVILEGVGANGFLPAAIVDFQKIDETGRSLGLLTSD